MPVSDTLNSNSHDRRWVFDPPKIETIPASGRFAVGPAGRPAKRPGLLNSTGLEAGGEWELR